MKTDRIYLEDIRERCERILTITSRITEEEYYHDFIYQDALIQSLEIIGEAAGKISEDFQKKHPEMPLRQIKDLRNVLIHQYSRVDLQRVWTITIKDIPDLYRKIDILLRNEKKLQTSSQN